MDTNRCCKIPNCFYKNEYISIENFDFPEFNINYRCDICSRIIDDSREYPRARLKKKGYVFCKLDCYYKWLLKIK